MKLKSMVMSTSIMLLLSNSVLSKDTKRLSISSLDLEEIKYTGCKIEGYKLKCNNFEIDNIRYYEKLKILEKEKIHKQKQLNAIKELKAQIERKLTDSHLEEIEGSDLSKLKVGINNIEKSLKSDLSDLRIEILEEKNFVTIENSYLKFKMNSNVSEKKIKTGESGFFINDSSDEDYISFNYSKENNGNIELIYNSEEFKIHENQYKNKNTILHVVSDAEFDITFNLKNKFTLNHRLNRDNKSSKEKLFQKSNRRTRYYCETTATLEKNNNNPLKSSPSITERIFINNFNAYNDDSQNYIVNGNFPDFYINNKRFKYNISIVSDSGLLTFNIKDSINDSSLLKFHTVNSSKYISLVLFENNDSINIYCRGE